MDGVAGALAGEVGEEQIDVRLADGSVLVKALKEISRTENIQNIWLHGDVGSCPWPYLVRQRSEGFAIGQGLGAAAGLKKNCRGRKESNRDRESPVWFHGRASLFPGSVWVIRKRR